MKSLPNSILNERSNTTSKTIRPEETFLAPFLAILPVIRSSKLLSKVLSCCQEFISSGILLKRGAIHTQYVANNFPDQQKPCSMRYRALFGLSYLLGYDDPRHVQGGNFYGSIRQ